MKNIIKLFCVISFFISSIVYADIKFWTTEVQPARMAKQEEMAKAFEAKTGIKVDVIPVEEKDLGTRATAAAAAGDLPDVIYHTLQYVLPWAEAGILDVDANNAVVKELGKDTFALLKNLVKIHLHQVHLTWQKKVQRLQPFQLMDGHKWLFIEKIFLKMQN